MCRSGILFQLVFVWCSGLKFHTVNVAQSCSLMYDPTGHWATLGEYLEQSFWLSFLQMQSSSQLQYVFHDQ